MALYSYKYESDATEATYLRRAPPINIVLHYKIFAALNFAAQMLAACFIPLKLYYSKLYHWSFYTLLFTLFYSLDWDHTCFTFTLSCIVYIFKVVIAK